MNIKPIKSRKDYQAAVDRIEKLMDAESKTQMDELDVLSTLVDAYESRHFPIPAPDPISAIKFRMEQRGLKQTDIARLIGSKPRASEILSGRRDLSLDMIRKLHKSLDIPVETLVGV